MARVEITLAGRNYVVSCEEGSESRLHDIATFVDARMRSITSAKPGIAETQALVLTSLMLADQIFDLRAELARTRTTSSNTDNSYEERAAGIIETLTSRIDAVATRLSKV